jgi:hypothetical protein
MNSGARSYIKHLKSVTKISTRKRVNLFIIGEQRCGTTSLYNLIARNENVLAASIKECHYFNTLKFIDDIDYKNYHNMFQYSFYKKYTYQLDASPDYLSDDKAFQNLYSYNPDSKIIIILRNPVQRFISAYDFYFSNIIENLEKANQNYFQYSKKGISEYAYLKRNKGLSVEQFLENELKKKSPIDALSRGNYFSSISKWLSTWDKKNICIVFFENFVSQERGVGEIKLLEDFLSLKFEHAFPRKNRSLKKEMITSDVLKTLDNYYREEMNKLKDVCSANLFSLKGEDFIREYINV